ncbi:MAG: right-handed parallel beta-helix repeat-containing protein [Paludibacteraceae bacterium]
MKNNKYLIAILIIFIYCSGYSKQYYLSPSGNDSNNGFSLASAWQSPNYAFSTLTSGDTLWVAGGTYTVNETVKSKNAGTQVAQVKVLAIRGEKPVFDCSSFRNYGSESSTYRGMDLRQAWWHVRGIKIYKAGHNGIIIAGANITVEGCVVEECGHDGISIGSGSVNALVLNCDSYRNAEVKGKGENGDGFAAKEGSGTVFRGCRAWENVDDGWDVYGGSEPVLVDSCWSFGNGVNYWPDLITSFQGDGNGLNLEVEAVLMAMPPM